MQWLRLDNADRLHAADEARRHLSRMPKREQLGLIAIFGSARQGKSFLMNKLAGGDGCGFTVSNKQDPCTVGIDLARNTVPLKTFCRVENPGADVRRVPEDIRVGFVDAEGQGDRDAAYDARIACPVLLASKCVIFNWRDSLQKDRMLDLLGVMCRAAQAIDLQDGSSAPSASVKPFGHLHIVFRDWNFDGDKTSVTRQLLESEPESESGGGGAGTDSDAAKRNGVRFALKAAFESVSVWLLPPPTEKTADLRKVLTPILFLSSSTLRYPSCVVPFCPIVQGAATWGTERQPSVSPSSSSSFSSSSSVASIISSVFFVFGSSGGGGKGRKSSNKPQSISHE